MSNQNPLARNESGIDATLVERGSGQIDLSLTEFDWSGQGQLDIDFGPNDKIPLKEGRFLGRGSFGDVHEVFCSNGLVVARKRLHLRKRMRIGEWKREAEIIQKLNHPHVIKLVGTFTHSKTLNFLLWPVAVCDLGSFLDDLDDFTAGDDSEGHWEALNIS